MKTNSVHMAMLFDFYGDILTSKQKEFFDLYHNEDLSLAEIAENANITRQGVRDIIIRAEATLDVMEDKLGLAARLTKLNDAIVQIKRSAEVIASIGHRYLNAEVYTHAEKIIELCADQQTGE